MVCFLLFCFVSVSVFFSFLLSRMSACISLFRIPIYLSMLCLPFFCICLQFTFVPAIEKHTNAYIIIVFASSYCRSPSQSCYRFLRKFIIPYHLVISSTKKTVFSRILLCLYNHVTFICSVFLMLCTPYRNWFRAHHVPVSFSTVIPGALRILLSRAFRVFALLFPLSCMSYRRCTR